MTDFLSLRYSFIADQASPLSAVLVLVTVLVVTLIAVLIVVLVLVLIAVLVLILIIHVSSSQYSLADDPQG